MGTVNGTLNSLGYPIAPGSVDPGGYVYTEFGNSISIPLLNLASSGGTKAAMDVVMADYERAKAQYFPHWMGFPDIKTQVGDSLHRSLMVSWYCVAPNQSGLTITDGMDEELWNQ